MTQEHPQTFADLVMAGKACYGEIDDYIDKWHQDNSPENSLVNLHVYLGFTYEEWCLFMQDCNNLERIFALRKQEQAMMLNESEESKISAVVTAAKRMARLLREGAKRTGMSWHDEAAKLCSAVDAISPPPTPPGIGDTVSQKT